MRNHVVSAQRVGRNINICVIDVVARERGRLVREAVVETEHARVLADGVGSHFGHLIGDAINRGLPDRIGVQNGLEHRGLREHLVTEAGVQRVYAVLLSDYSSAQLGDDLDFTAACIETVGTTLHVGGYRGTVWTW